MRDSLAESLKTVLEQNKVCETPELDTLKDNTDRGQIETINQAEK